MPSKTTSVLATKLSSSSNLHPVNSWFYLIFFSTPAQASAVLTKICQTFVSFFKQKWVVLSAKLLTTDSSMLRLLSGNSVCLIAVWALALLTNYNPHFFFFLLISGWDITKDALSSHTLSELSFTLFCLTVQLIIYSQCNLRTPRWTMNNKYKRGYYIYLSWKINTVQSMN